MNELDCLHGIIVIACEEYGGLVLLFGTAYNLRDFRPVTSLKNYPLYFTRDYPETGKSTSCRVNVSVQKNYGASAKFLLGKPQSK